jgi:hypothetical protein
VGEAQQSAAGFVTGELTGSAGAADLLVLRFHLLERALEFCGHRCTSSRVDSTLPLGVGSFGSPASGTVADLTPV